MDNDAIEVIEEIKELVEGYDPRQTSFSLEEIITMYLENKLTEFQPSCGDCAG
jgi:hypothetical protein